MGEAQRGSEATQGEMGEAQRGSALPPTGGFKPTSSPTIALLLFLCYTSESDVIR